MRTVSAGCSAFNDSPAAPHNRFLRYNPKIRYDRYHSYNRYIPESDRDRNNRHNTKYRYDRKSDRDRSNRQILKTRHNPFNLMIVA